MVSSKKSKKTAQKTDKTDPSDKIIDAALTWASKHGWQSLHLDDLCPETGLSLDEIQTVFPKKSDILRAFIKRVDDNTFTDYAADEGDSTRERLFDLMMRRFDEFNHHKDAMKEIVQYAWCRPKTLCSRGCSLYCSMRKLLETAGVNVSGFHGMARAQALSLIFLSTFRIWLKDNSDDMSKTMARLDKRLGAAERFEARCVCRPKTSSV